MKVYYLKMWMTKNGAVIVEEVQTSKFKSFVIARIPKNARLVRSAAVVVIYQVKTGDRSGIPRHSIDAPCRNNSEGVDDKKQEGGSGKMKLGEHPRALPLIVNKKIVNKGNSTILHWLCHQLSLWHNRVKHHQELSPGITTSVIIVSSSHLMTTT
jgi:hypothetical protein